MSTVRVTDADLVARARSGDQTAFGELVDRHRAAVYRAAIAALGTHAEADDAAQDTFVLAWRRLESFRGESSFRTWLLTIAWHQSINRRRSFTRWWKHTVPFETEIREPGDVATSLGATAVIVAASAAAGATPEQLASTVELRRDIMAAVRALSPKLRDALLLALSGAHTYDEIGAMIGVPVGTIKWRVAEARRLVKRQLQKHGHVELG